jgi:tRNA dimethylallyltransferase
LTKLLVIIAGPTCSGKTRLAIDLAIQFNTEIVSADSRQFYRELTIGTAKPNEYELREIPHHLINSNSISRPLNAGNYASEAKKILNRLFGTFDIVIMVGGSGLYIDAVIHGIDDLPAADENLRAELQKVFKSSGITALQQLLKSNDPDSFGNIDINNPRRLIRALEVTISSGQPYSRLLGKSQEQVPWNLVIAGIDWPRNELYNRINERTQAMVHDGLKNEVASLMAFRHMNALQTVGYKEMFDHLDGNITLDETTTLIAQHTRNYAKRQLTWFRKYKEMIWIKPGEEKKLAELIKNKLNSIT